MGKLKRNAKTFNILVATLILILTSMFLYYTSHNIVYPMAFIIFYGMFYFLFREFKLDDMNLYKYTTYILFLVFFYYVFTDTKSPFIFYFLFIIPFIFAPYIDKNTLAKFIFTNIFFEGLLVMYFIFSLSSGDIYRENIFINILGFSVVTLIMYTGYFNLETRFHLNQNKITDLSLEATELSTKLHNLSYTKEKTSEITYRFNQYLFNLEKTKTAFQTILEESLLKVNINKGNEDDLYYTLSNISSAISDVKNDIERTQQSFMTFLNESNRQLNFYIDEEKNSELILTANENNDENLNHLIDSTSNVHSSVELIRGISNQINLLSLNAAIESSKAGDSGRRFSVIAKEIKNLQIDVLSILQKTATELATIERCSLNIKDGNKTVERRAEDMLSQKLQTKNLNQGLNKYLKDLITKDEVNVQKLNSVNTDMNNSLKKLGEIIEATKNIDNQLEDSFILFNHQSKITNELTSMLDNLQNELLKLTAKRNKK